MSFVVVDFLTSFILYCMKGNPKLGGCANQNGHFFSDLYQIISLQTLWVWYVEAFQMINKKSAV